MKKEEKFEAFLTSNLIKTLEAESKQSLGDRSEYIGASDIGGCPFKTVMSKRRPPRHSLSQQIIFQRGHLAETLVSKMLNGLHVIEQHEALGEIDEFQLKAHLDKLIMSKDRCVVVEVKTVSAPVEEPYESWVLQVIYQMGLLMQDCDHNVEAYVLAMDLNTGWLKTFKIEFDDALFELCLSKATHLIEALRGECEPKAIIQNYCSLCPFLMECPKQGKLAEEIPEDIKADIEYIKGFNAMKKGIDAKKRRVKDYLVNTGIELAKNSDAETVVSLKEQKSSRFDTARFKKEHPELYAEYINESSSFKMNIL